MSSDAYESSTYVAYLVDVIRGWREVASQPPPITEADSELAEDALRNPRYQGAYFAWAGITGTMDHLDAVQSLIYGARTLHTYAPYALIRAALENAALAVWLLGPDERQTRLTRALHLAYEDMKQERAASGLLPELKRKTPLDVLQQRVLDLADSLDIDRKVVAKGFAYANVVREAAGYTTVPADAVCYTWRLCSGYAHGRRWASLHALNREVSTSGDKDTATVRFTTDVDAVISIAGVAVMLNQTAMKLYERRRQALR